MPFMFVFHADDAVDACQVGGKVVFSFADGAVVMIVLQGDQRCI
jgi:hypothetical protein